MAAGLNYRLTLYVYPLPLSLPAVAVYSSHFSFDQTLLFLFGLSYTSRLGDYEAKRELAEGHIRGTVGSFLEVSLNVTLPANTQINADNWTRKQIVFMCCLLDKHC